MRAMPHHALWRPQPPALPAAVLSCLTEAGSLTERLQATGRRFAVRVLKQQTGPCLADEAPLLSLAAGAPLLAREVALTLDDTPVVFARSVARLDCADWLPILDRGSRSLGLTLFSELPDLRRDPLHYQLIDADHPLFEPAAALSPHQSYPARRCRFLLRQAPLLICELFLPELETLL
ncbi:chorismate lyase [Chromobacterium sp. LK1]|nr:chorismate lyase [Chromobacterium sp. LK1]